MQNTTHEPVAALMERFDAFQRAFNGKSCKPLRSLQNTAMQRVVAMGFPTQKHEEWRYTNLTALYAGVFAPAAPREAPAPEGIAGPLVEADPDSPVLVFLDGAYMPDASKQAPLPGVTIMPISEAIRTRTGEVLAALDATGAGGANVFAEMNSAFLADGAWIMAERGTPASKPIRILHLSSGNETASMASPRVAVLAERGASVAVTEIHAVLGEGRCYENARTDIALREGASVEHARVQLGNDLSLHTSNTHTLQSKDSTFVSHVYTLGGALTRNDMSSVLDGENAEARLFGLALAGGESHVDNHTRIDHARPRGRSIERYKGIVGGAGRSVFSGRIIVRPDAQKTDARQSNSHLLLSNEASADAKPQLEIFADDVKCTHGATVGRLDENALFYLRSRGLGLEEARGLLTYAFAGELLEELADSRLGEALDGVLRERLLRIF